jgi:hypothetical protein
MGAIYFMRSGTGDHIKIGRTKGDVETRRLQLATGNPHLMIIKIIETDFASHGEAYLKGILRSKKLVGDGGDEFYVLCQKDIEQATEELQQYITEYAELLPEVTHLETQDGDPRLLTPGNFEFSIYRDLLEAREQECRYSARRDILESRLKIAIGSASGLEGMATWKSAVTHRFDTKTFKQEHADLYAAFSTESRSRRFRLL